VVVHQDMYAYVNTRGYMLTHVRTYTRMCAYARIVAPPARKQPSASAMELDEISLLRRGNGQGNCRSRIHEKNVRPMGPWVM